MLLPGAYRVRLTARTRGLLFAAMLAVCAPVARAAETRPAPTQESVLAEALAAFDQASAQVRRAPQQAVADYRRSAELFEALVADGVHNGKLYYNLGNTYLQLGQLGRAILNYRRAEALIGTDPQLQANLRYARSIRRNQIAPSGQRQFLRTAFFWHYETALAARYAVAAIAWFGFWTVLIVRALIRRRANLGYIALGLAVLWVSAGVSVGIELAQRHTERAGVTVQNDIVVRKGNGEAYDPQFDQALHEGVEFIVVDERPAWLHIELPDGNRGWIRDAQAELL